MSKRGFVRGKRKPPPNVPPVRVAVAAPLALPEREPRNILLMIALPALLVGIVGTLVVMYASGIRSLQSGFFPMIGLVGFGTLMFGGRFGRGRRISWGEQEKQRRSYLRQLDEDRDEVQRAAQEQRRSQLFVHGDPQQLDTVIGGPRMWERRPRRPGFPRRPSGDRCAAGQRIGGFVAVARRSDRGGARTGNRWCAKGFHSRAEQDSRDRQGAEPAFQTRIQFHR